MRNHDQKIKDIQRSVLPSTTGKYAREQRRIIHKQNRSASGIRSPPHARSSTPTSTPTSISTSTKAVQLGI